MTRVVVFSTAGREELTAATLAQLNTHGGGSQLQFPPSLFWTGVTPPPTIPQGWRVSWPGVRVSPDVDFFKMLRRFVSASDDLLILEDDIIACRNALPYMERFAPPSPAVVSFFNPAYPGMNRPLGYIQTKQNPTGATMGFEFAQACKLPASFVKRLTTDPIPPQRTPGLDGGDMIIGRCLRVWGLPFYQHQSLVEHVGERSTWTPSKLTGARRARGFVGLEYDALGGTHAASVALDPGDGD